jgi:hypothetical protein
MGDKVVEWFIENFHIFFGKEYLKKVHQVVEGSPGLPFDLNIEKIMLNTDEFDEHYEEFLYNLLKESIISCYPIKKGGGLTLGALKQDIRKRISLIVPRKTS